MKEGMILRRPLSDDSISYSEWLSLRLILWILLVIQKPTLSLMWSLRRNNKSTPRAKKRGRKPTPENKWQAYTLNNRRAGKCPRCGKSCAPFAACDSCRAYKAKHCYESRILKLGAYKEETQ